MQILLRSQVTLTLLRPQVTPTLCLTNRHLLKISFTDKNMAKEQPMKNQFWKIFACGVLDLHSESSGDCICDYPLQKCILNYLRKLWNYCFRFRQRAREQKKKKLDKIYWVDWSCSKSVSFHGQKYQKDATNQKHYHCIPDKPEFYVDLHFFLYS